MSVLRHRAIWAAVTVAALGYFVDVFDLILFSVVRLESLKSLGVEGEALLRDGVLLLNSQMGGMLIGGVLFGIWGDKKGRLSVLFGSILMYSVANILNSFVQSVPMYAVLRFVAGVGLAGELGAGITLVSETLPKERRGLGTTAVATIGVCGALAASVVGKLGDWRQAYLVAGVLGLALLGLRVAVQESGLFSRVADRAHVARGDLRLLVAKGERLGRLLYCMLPGLPIWFVLGILVTFSPELATSRGFAEPLHPADAVFFCYLGFIGGDFASGLLSQLWRTRKKVLRLFLWITTAFSVYLLAGPEPTGVGLRVLYVCVGFGAGYWAVFITVAAEQFGTNLRATVATSVPNFIRGAVVPMTLAVNALKGSMGFSRAGLVVLAVIVGIAALSLERLRDSFHADLDFLET